MAIYEIAISLHKFAYEVMDMPYDEFVNWQIYFKFRPLGWQEDQRTLKLLQIQGFKGSAREVFHTLAQMEDANLSVRKATSGLGGSKFFEMMQSAKGGIKLGVKE